MSNDGQKDEDKKTNATPLYLLIYYNDRRLTRGDKRRQPQPQANSTNGYRRKTRDRK